MKLMNGIDSVLQIQIRAGIPVMRRLSIQILIQVLDILQRAQEAERRAAMRAVNSDNQLAKCPHAARDLTHFPAERTMLVQREWIHLSEFNTLLAAQPLAARLLQFM